jgi:hypothetical protein
VLALAPQSADNAGAVAAVTALYSWISVTYPAFNGSTLGGTGFSNPLLRSVSIPSLASQVRLFPDEAAINSYVTSASYASAPFFIWGAIVINSAAPAWDYSVRMNATMVPSTVPASSVNIIQRGVNLRPLQQYTWTQPGSGGGPAFVAQTFDAIAVKPYPGFLTLQLMMDRFILNTPLPLSSMDASTASVAFGQTIFLTSALSPSAISAAIANESGTAAGPALLASAAAWIAAPEAYAPQTVDMMAFPTFAYTNATIFNALTFIFGIFFIITFLYPLARLIRGVVLEKETKVAEGMRMMGLPYWTLLWSWMTLYFIMYTFISVVTAILLKVSVFKSSDFFYIWLLFFFFGISSVAFAYLITVFFLQ